MLEVNNVHTYYGIAYVLQGITLKVKERSIVTILGRNGMGKTTTIRTIIGLNQPRKGKVMFKGDDITSLPPYVISKKGIGLVPQGRNIFPSLSVKENLLTTSRLKGKDNEWELEKIYEFFPILKARAKFSGTNLSGGEQQMLAIARAMMTNPDLLLMDEPSEGLAPAKVWEIGGIIKKLKEVGATILLVEQNLPLAMAVSDYVYIINKGQIVYESTPNELMNNEDIKSKYLGIAL